MSSKFLLLLSKAKPIWETLSNLYIDFINEVYSVEGTPATFDSYVTHSRSGNATMTDSDGLIKWAAHNLVAYSDDVGNASSTWSETNVIASGKTVTATSTSGNHRIDAPTFNTEGRITVKVRVKPNGYNYFGIREQTTTGAEAVFFLNGSGSVPYSTAGSGSNLSTNNVFDGEYYEVSLSISASSFASVRLYVLDSNPASNLNSYSWSGDDASGVIIDRAHVYRSDLGGMVDNPDRGDSYVPTTSSAVYLPRRGHHVYNGSTWVNEGLLVESESRQNLLQYSEAFDLSPWTTFSATTTSDVTSDPSGNTTADKLVESASTTTQGKYQDVSATVGTYTLSVFAKASERDHIQISMHDGSGNYAWAKFNLTTSVIAASGEVGTSTLDAVTGPESFGNGWYRVSITASDVQQKMQVGPATDASSTSSYGYSSYAGDGTSGVYVWGAQLEAGSTPSSYIPTAGSAITRAAETLTIPSANLPYPTPNVIGSELQGNALGDRSALSGSYSGASTSYVFANSGSVFQISVTISDYTAGLLDIGDNADRNTIVNNLSSNGTYVYYFVPDDGTIYFTSDASSDYTLDVSVKEIDPLSVSIQMDGRMTYADEDDFQQAIFVRWYEDVSNEIGLRLRTTGTDIGEIQFFQRESGNSDAVTTDYEPYSPGINVPFNIASRHGSTFINGAVNGTALTANTTPTALPDLSSTDLQLAYDYMGTIRTFRIWDADLTDEGIEFVST